MKAGLMIGAFTLVLIAVGAVGNEDYKEAVRSQELYCENVALYKDSNGEYGWPDYESRYERDC